MTPRLPRPYGTRRREPHRVSGSLSLVPVRISMLDIILIAGGLGFFALSVAYAYGCDRL